MIIGEMQFRFTEYPPNYYANHFLYSIARAGMKLEILQTLSTRAVWLSEHNGMARENTEAEPEDVIKELDSSKSDILADIEQQLFKPALLNSSNVLDDEDI